MAYVDVDDIRQHFRQSGALDDDTIEEIMGEQESYVKARLRLATLPPDNDILKQVIRNLTVSHVIFNVTSVAGDYDKGTALRSEALRLLNEIGREGMGIRPNPFDQAGGWESEVINPYGEDRFFNPSDFGL